MRGNSHVRFLGEKGAAMPLTYPISQKQGDFFVESPIILFAAVLSGISKIYKNGKYCTFPHAIEFLNRTVRRHFPYPDLLSGAGELPFSLHGRMEGKCSQEQLQGQIASAKIPLSRMISPQLYWVMTGRRFYTGHQQSRRAENALRGQQSRQAEHLLGGTRIV